MPANGNEGNTKTGPSPWLPLLPVVGLYHPAAGGDLDLEASLFAIHLVLHCWEWIQCMCASVCSSGRLRARPLGWHHSVQNLMLALLFSRGNEVCVPTQLSRLQAEERGGSQGGGGYEGYARRDERGSSQPWKFLLRVMPRATVRGRKGGTVHTWKQTSATSFCFVTTL